MSSAGLQNRQGNAEEYLRSMRSLSEEIEKAMQAIAHNALSDLEESVGIQQMHSTRLGMLAEALSVSLDADLSIVENSPGDNLAVQINSAANRLQNLNRCYAALLRHSSRCAGQMTLLFQSYQGNFQEASGPGSNHQTWSCQM